MKVNFLRIRHPDAARPQKGCDDIRVENYDQFKDKYLGKFGKNMTLIKRPGYEMIEIKDKEFDVLVYCPSIRFSEELSKK